MPLLSKSLYSNMLSSIVLPKSKNVAFSPLCSSFSSICLGLICLYEEENPPSSLIVQRSSLDLEIPWDLKARGDPLDINYWKRKNIERGSPSTELGLCPYESQSPVWTLGFRYWNNILWWETGWHQSKFILWSISVRSP